MGPIARTTNNTCGGKENSESNRQERRAKKCIKLTDGGFRDVQSNSLKTSAVYILRANRKYPQADQITYRQIVLKYTYIETG